MKKIEVQKIAARIRLSRRERGLTQQELAALCNFPGPWKISRLEGGKKGSGIERIDTLEVVCQELGIELWELLKPDFVIPGESRMMLMKRIKTRIERRKSLRVVNI